MKYSHLFAIAFTVDSDNDEDSVTEEELSAALDRRIREVDQHGGLLEACGTLSDTTEFKDESEK